ncbi:MAG TPA: peptidylprolyl isomerase [Terracidiphilus sp.]|jgi:peptidyl-prolyl cis-trans isomerase SurA|nr:peptidylprolyl isomerase [Terracidiphilus sp.]HUX27798.1 peptidylprolyl isomerase [Terracidiphilus sp.]
MTLRFLRIPAAIVFGTALLAGPALVAAQNSAPQSPYGGVTVEDIIARVNDQIITRSDYDRAMAEVDQEARQRGATTMQEISAAHTDLLRNLIDQQLWLSRGKQLGITGDTELIKRLDEIRKQYHLDTLEDLEKAAKSQGVSYEDFKANIRNQIITQDVMRQEVGANIRFTPGEAERYYAQHKQDYSQPESVTLSEILISTGTAGSSDPAKLAAAKAKAEDLETRLHAGGNFSELAKSFSDGPTAAQGGDLGQYQRGALPKLLEEKTFPLKTGEFTEPILTRQGYIILKVVQHNSGGPRPFKDVESQVEDAFYMSRMEPAIRAYLTKLREESYIDIKPGYTDTGASPNETKPVFSAYTPPSSKKKKKVERTRFRETTHSFRQKSPQAEEAATAPAVVKVSEKKTKKHEKNEKLAIEKPGKKEKIRFGQKPRETLPSEPNGAIENAGALPETASSVAEPANPLEPTAPETKTRFSARARAPKKDKHASASQPDTLAPPPPDAAEVADRATQSGPLGLAGDTASKKKKKETTEGEKTRMADRKKEPGTEKQQPQFTPAPQEPGAPAPEPQTEAPAPSSQQ